MSIISSRPLYRVGTASTYYYVVDNYADYMNIIIPRDITNFEVACNLECTNIEVEVGFGSISIAYW